MRSFGFLLICTFIPLYGGTFRAIVLDDDSGAGVPDASVRILGASRGVLFTDRNGRFEVTVTGKKSVDCEIRKALYYVTNVSFSAPDSDAPSGTDIAIHVIRLIRYGVISGRIIGASGMVVAFPITDGMSLRPTGWTSQVGQSGEYRLFGLPYGKYFVGVSNIRTSIGLNKGLIVHSSAVQPLEVGRDSAMDQIADIAIPETETYAISGIVNGDVPQSTIVLCSSSLPHFPLSVQLSDTNGRFRFDSVQPGDYILYGISVGSDKHPEQKYVRSQVRVKQSSVTDLRLDLGPGRSLKISRNPESVGVACLDATVVLTSVDGWLQMEALFARVEAGKTVILAVAPGKYRVTSGGSNPNCIYDFVPKLLDVTDSKVQGRVLVQSLVAGTVHGTVQCNAQEKGCAVILWSSEEFDAPINIVFTTLSGEFSFPLVPPGTYRIFALSAVKHEGSLFRSSNHKTFRLEAGGQAKVVLQLQGREEIR